ncbi:MAG: hypothetical protein K0Q70_2209 [Rhodospirillales bacterium]|jgi:hypothetical protein|nr:hypothetical protein [Rhodospirillales bacterium]
MALKATRKKPAAKRKKAVKKSARKWSGRVTRESDAMDLKKGVFKSNSPRKIAKSVKLSATRSKRRKAGPYQSAMSMLNFYINRGGKNLPASKKRTLERAKDVLRELFDKD